MKIVSFLFSLIICSNIISQTILSDKKDAANTRKISSGTNPLYKAGFAKTADVQSQLNIDDDSITSYNLNFIMPLQTSSNSEASSCLLQAEDGTVFSGVADTASLQTNSKTYRFKFSKEDFYKIINTKIKSIKINVNKNTGNILKVSESLQNVISNQAKVLLERFKASSLNQ